jgi:cytochrome c oxidase assembly factor CtaG
MSNKAAKAGEAGMRRSLAAGPRRIDTGSSRLRADGPQEPRRSDTTRSQRTQRHTCRAVLAASANTSFSLAPGPIVIVLLLAGVYVYRWRQVRASGSTRGASWVRLASWMTGVLALAIALISPIDSLADQVFAMHMIQHVLLLDFVPVFLILGLTKVLLRPIARTVLDAERALGPLAHPLFAICFYVGSMWVWHLPALYDLALRHSGIHVLEHTFFLSAGFLYWWHLLSPVRGRHFGGLAPVGYMLSTKLAVGLLGIALTFAPNAIYDFYKHQPQVWGLTPHDDQTLAGAIMAIEQSIVMGIALAYLFVRALSESERAQEREDRLLDQQEAEAAAKAAASR